MASPGTATFAQVQAVANQITALDAKVTSLQSQVTALANAVQTMGNQGTAAVIRLADEVDQLTP